MSGTLYIYNYKPDWHQYVTLHTVPESATKKANEQHKSIRAYGQIYVLHPDKQRARGSVVGRGTTTTTTGSIPDELIWFFNWPNPSSRTVALGSTQPLTEMSTRNLPGGQRAGGAWGWPHRHLWADCLEQRYSTENTRRHRRGYVKLKNIYIISW
jgi:hypothetical protein